MSALFLYTIFYNIAKLAFICLGIACFIKY